MSVPIRPATTVVLLRDAPDGFEVFLVQRSRVLAFLPSAWVFPGGRVDDGDRLAAHPLVRGGASAIARTGLPFEEAVASLVAGVRETFEEAGVWLGEGMPVELRDQLGRDGRPLADLLDETGAVVDLDRVHLWSQWVTPAIEPRRFDTRFLVAIAPEQEARHDLGETVDSVWLRPAEAVARAERGDLPTAPPTWWTLRELAEFQHLDEVIAAAQTRVVRPIEPRGHQDGAAFDLLLPGHPEHPDPAIPGLPTHVHYAQGRWWAR